MLKRMPVLGIWLLAAIALVGAIAFMAYKQHDATIEYKRECQTKSATVAATAAKQGIASTEECKDPKDYMPWWYVLMAWPDGITVWAIIATGFVIAWQSYETRKSAEATKASAVASVKQSALMEQQITLQRSERRGVLEVNSEPLEVSVFAEDATWSLVGVIRLYQLRGFSPSNQRGKRGLPFRQK